MNRWEWLFVVAALSTSLAITAHFVPLVEGKGKTYEIPSVRTVLPKPSPSQTPQPSQEPVQVATRKVEPLRPPASSGDILGRIRRCESGGNYQTNTGNGYYGAYQYDRQSWGGYGGYATADQAPPSVQDQKAQEDYARRGGAPWPTCSRR